MELNSKVTQLEDEIKILKSEVQAVLLDLRDSCLSGENPFNPAAPPVNSQPIIINQMPPVPDEPPPTTDGEHEVTPEETRESELPKVEEPASEPEPADKPELIASEKAVHEDVKRAWRVEIEPGLQFKARKATAGPEGKADLATIAGLVQWVTESTGRLGRERTNVILDTSEMMGHLPPDIKEILGKFISLTPDGCSGEVATRDYLISLIELDSLLGKGNKSEIALLSILSQENGHR